MIKKIIITLLIIGAIITAFVLYKNRRSVPDVKVVKQLAVNEKQSDSSGVIKNYFLDFENSGGLNGVENLSAEKLLCVL